MSLLAGKHLGEKMARWGEAYLSGQSQATNRNESHIPLESVSTRGSLEQNGSNVGADSERPRLASLHVPEYVPSTKSFLSLIGFFLLTTAAIWILVFNDVRPYRNQWWVAMAFGPFGAVIRYLLSLHNAKFPDFPLFTFIANIAGTVLNIIILMLDNHFEHTSHLSAEGELLSTYTVSTLQTYKFWVRFGLSGGMMGSLSTVSTWVNEIWTLAHRNTWFAYRYAICSLLIGQLTALLLGGIWIISGNFLDLWYGIIFVKMSCYVFSVRLQNLFMYNNKVYS